MIVLLMRMMTIGVICWDSEKVEEKRMQPQQILAKRIWPLNFEGCKWRMHNCRRVASNIYHR